MESAYHFRDFIGRKVLIIGDVGVGKTGFLIKLLKEAVELGLAKDVSVIDLAPKVVEVKGRKIGGKISDFVDNLPNIRYLTVEVVPPRITARTGEELLRLINLNKRRIDRILKSYLDDPTPIVFVNDISIYLQSGKIALMTSLIKAAETFIADGYYGKSLEHDLSTGVSRREKELMEELAKRMDFTIRL